MKKVSIGSTNHICRIQKRSNAKRLVLSVRDGQRVLLTIPYWSTYKQANKFLKKKQNWILKTLAKTEKRNSSMLNLGTREDYLQNRDFARAFVEKRVRHFNNFYKFEIGRISIRNQRSRWGSCSEKNNLNFNYRIIHLPAEFSDYLIVHELCHLQELNHSAEFWSLVSQTIPNCKNIAKELRKM